MKAHDPLSSNFLKTLQNTNLSLAVREIFLEWGQHIKKNSSKNAKGRMKILLTIKLGTMTNILEFFFNSTDTVKVPHFEPKLDFALYQQFLAM